MPTPRDHADAELRRCLIEERSELRALLTNTMLDHSGESANATWLELSKGIDPLIAGEAVGLRRFELPLGHPQAPPLGHPSDWLLLGAADVLRLDK